MGAVRALVRAATTNSRESLDAAAASGMALDAAAPPAPSATLETYLHAACGWGDESAPAPKVIQALATHEKTRLGAGSLDPGVT